MYQCTRAPSSGSRPFPLWVLVSNLGPHLFHRTYTVIHLRIPLRSGKLGLDLTYGYVELIPCLDLFGLPMVVSQWGHVSAAIVSSRPCNPPPKKQLQRNGSPLQEKNTIRLPCRLCELSQQRPPMLRHASPRPKSYRWKMRPLFRRAC